MNSPLLNVQSENFSEALAAIRAERLYRQTKKPIPAPCTATKANWPPDYGLVLAWRRKQQAAFEIDPALIPSAKAYYKTHPVEFINHWGTTYDPRNATRKLPTHMPFILFERQAQFVDFVVSCLHDQANGLVEKSRDMGATWVCVGISVWLWLFWDGAAIGWGSRKKELVDRIGDPDSIFEKIRMFIMALPPEFWPRGFVADEHLPSMKIINPETGATITGEIGDAIGRGGRKLIFFKDEAAHYEHPEMIEAALGDNTNIQIDISSVAGPNNVFHRKRLAGHVWVPGCSIAPALTRVFIFDWRDHPAKTEEWYEQRRAAAEANGLTHLLAQEVDRDYLAAVQGVIIPAAWVRAAIDAHVKLGFDDSGPWSAALDVADDGAEAISDANALTLRKGVVLRRCETWGGIDTGKTAQRAIGECRQLGRLAMQYDVIGVGAGIKSEYNRLVREGMLPRSEIILVPWNGASKVLHPERKVDTSDPNPKAPLNKDFFKNLKAQGWWALRTRFEKTFKAVTQGMKYDPSELISLDSTMPRLRELEAELSQPVRDYDGQNKLVVEKTPAGTRSPNMADSVMMNYFPMPGAIAVSKEAVKRVMAGPRRRQW